MSDLLLAEMAAREEGVPIFSFDPKPPRGIAYPEHLRGLAITISKALTEVWRRAQRRPGALLCSPIFRSHLDALPTEKGGRLQVHGSCLEMHAIAPDRYPDFMVGEGEAWLMFAVIHKLLDPRAPLRRRLPDELYGIPGKPVAILQLEGYTEHPLTRLARCAP